MTTTTSLTVQDRVSRWAVELPAASRVFMRHDIDYCCGGARPLAEACAEAGLDAESVAREIRREEEAQVRREAPLRWDERPLGELIDHIVETFHRPLEEELPRLGSMMAAVVRAHGEKDPVRIPALADVLGELFADLRDHMAREEDAVFPWIRSGRGDTAGPPVAALVDDHRAAAEALARIRELTDGFTPPPDACATWSSLYQGLRVFDRTLRHHVHLENNVLFPRALADAGQGAV